MTINEKQDEIIEEFTELDDWMDRYQLLIDLGNEQEPLNEKYKTESNLIDGCQSRVWLQCDEVDGKLIFQAESDALIVSGPVQHGIHRALPAVQQLFAALGIHGGHKLALHMPAVGGLVQILGHSAAGSSMICTDPKGELFQMHSKMLTDHGYKCMVLDLRDPYSSFRWNPLADFYDRYQ